MTKIIFCLLALSVAGRGVLLAQDNRNVAPAPVRQCFHNNYPNAMAVTWEKLGSGWWNGTSRSNGQTVSKSCDMDGQGAIVALPIRETYIPEDMVASLSEKYGPGLYNITCIKGTDGNDHYVVRLLQNGQLRSEQVAAR